MESKKSILLDKISFGALITTIIGSFFFFIPYIGITLEVSKGLWVGVGTMLAAFFWVLARLVDGKFEIPKDQLLIFGVSLPLVFLISSFFSSSAYTSLFGGGFEIGTFGSILTLFILFFLSAIHFQTEKRFWYFYISIFAAAGLLAIFELVHIFFGFNTFLPGFLRGIPASNLVGYWNDFAFFFGVITLLALLAIEFLKMRLVWKVLLYVLTGVSLFFLAIVNIPLVWLLVGLFGTLMLVYSISLQQSKLKISQELTHKKRFPVGILVVVLTCLVFLIDSNSISNVISSYFNISNSDIRPSFIATSEVASKVLRINPIFGSGPNTFSIDWSLFRSKDIVNTVAWDTNFSSAVGWIPTFLITTGILGFFAWILFLVVFALRGIQSLRVALSNIFSHYFIISTLVVSFYSWISLIFHTPNIVLFVLAFSSSGVLIGILAQKKVIHTIRVSFLHDPRSSFFSILGLVMCLIMALSGAYIYTEKFASAIYFSRSLNASSNNLESLVKSEQFLLRAIALDKNDVYYRALSQVYAAEMALVLNDKTISEDTFKSNMQKLATLMEQTASLAVNQNQKQYLNWMNFGNMYASLMALQVPNSFENAQAAYQRARELAPTNPVVLLSMAQLEFAHKNESMARKFIQDALDMKPDYTDAIFFLAQIEVSTGNLEKAIKQAEYAAQLSPNDPTVFFRLGLLRYNNSDYVKAISAFQTAVLINPNYMNARYFLGQSYVKSGRKSEALEQFRILNSVAPENQEIKDAILSLTKPSVDPVVDQKGNKKQPQKTNPLSEKKI